MRNAGAINGCPVHVALVNAGGFFLADPYHQRIGCPGFGRRLAGTVGVSVVWFGGTVVGGDIN
jgi:hypothetical protein